MNLGDHWYITKSFLEEKGVHKIQFYGFISRGGGQKMTTIAYCQYCVYAYIGGHWLKNIWKCAYVVYEWSPVQMKLLEVDSH